MTTVQDRFKSDKDTPAERRTFRIGIDVGGTFTKAVIVDNADRTIVGRYSVLTTHEDERGVAAGVVAAFRQVLARSDVDPQDVVFIAHSTTQATNALLEGDIAKVGVIGLAGQAAAQLAEPQVTIPAFEIADGRMLATGNRFLQLDGLRDDRIETAIAELSSEGCEVLVVSCAFGVDNTSSEERVRELGSAVGLLTTCGHEITRLYGLTKRTKTAVINASILPMMNATASMTEASVKEAGIAAPLMIMRGDGGVMDIREMRRRPALTTLSGPAASVAGALMHLRVSDGIYFEVGGTSTNVGVIRDGRPTVTYARIGGHETYINSLDVRVLGVAGGSLLRVRDGVLADVGPRSAHIAGLAYAAFAEPKEIVSPRVSFFEPRPGDGCDYVAVTVAGGQRYALTTTCAANVLGLVTPDMHAYADPESARLCFAALADHLGMTVEESARAVLQIAGGKVRPVIDELIRQYRLDGDQCLLIGEGGGAGALVPYLAEQAGMPFEISRDAEVISSIGVALAMVREVIERIIPHPKPDDLVALRGEAIDAVVRLGASADSVEVTVEIDQATHRVRATAVGAAELLAQDLDGSITFNRARRIAARSMALAAEQSHCVGETAGTRVFQPAGEVYGRLRVVDSEGTIRLRRKSARVRATTVADLGDQIGDLWTKSFDHGADDQTAPELFMVIERRIVDLSKLETLDQIISLAASEVQNLQRDCPVVVIASQKTSRDRDV